VRNRSKINELKEEIKNLYGRHHPVLYKPEYGFEESWQSSALPSETNRKYSAWKNESRSTQAF
jgi:hypothetical protein